MTFEFREVAIAEIEEDNIRRSIDPASLDELGKSMDEVGQLDPVLLRRKEKGFRLIAGHRRLQVRKLRGETTILARIVEAANDAEAIQKALISNVQRDAMRPLDIAIAAGRYMKETGKSSSQTAAALAFDHSPFVKLLSFLKLPRPLAEALSENGFGSSVAYELALIDDPVKQAEVGAKVLAGKVKRDAIKAAAATPSGKPAAPRGGSRFSAPWNGQAITITGLADGSLEEVIALLEGLLQRARRERTKGHSAKTLAKMLREEKGDTQ